MKLPERKPLASQAVKVICEMIAAGEFGQSLPGERELAARLQIGRDTLRAALAELESLGWISPARHGKRREVVRRAPGGKTAVRARRVGFLSPKRLEQLAPAMLLEVDHLREILASKDISLEVHSPSVFSTDHPGKRLGDLLASHRCDAWILHQSTEQVQAWFEQNNIPCIIRGYPYPGSTLPSLDLDWKAAGLHAGALLTRHGHHALGLMIPDTPLQGLQAAEQGLRNALSNHPGETTLHVIKDHRTAEHVASALHRVFQAEHPPTAIVTTRSRQLLTLLSWLASHRLSIPQDLSVVSLTYDTVYDALVPQISCYNLAPPVLARHLARKLDAVMDSSADGQKKLIPEFCPGSSVRMLGD